MALEAIMANSAFKVFLTGAGFFADSYDLFAVEGVNNILKGLGPAVKVPYNGTNFYFSQYCTDTAGTSCLPYLRDATTGAWVPNAATTYTSEYEPRYQQQTGDNKASVANAAIIGSILGQLCFGVAGDLLGRKWSFVLSSMLLILGCLGSATAMAGVTLACTHYVGGMCASNNQQPVGSWDNVYIQLAIWRGLLGFGVGGEYPLASTISSEGSKSGSRGRAVATVFSMQGWGKVAAAVINYAVISTCTYYGGTLPFDGTWRVSLALGCVPNLLTLYFRWRLHESEIYSKQKKAETGVDGDTLVVTTEDAKHHKHKHLAALPFATTLAVLWEYKWTLLGTAGSWFLLDVTFYGQGLMNTSVVQSSVASTLGVTNGMTKLRQSLLGSVWVVLIALPGYWVAIALMDIVGRWPLQIGGFALEVVVFALLGGLYNTALRLNASGAGFIVLYGLTFFFANAGPNSTTFIMPAEAFPTRARATAHGISAAMGKVGATVGSYALLARYNSYCTLNLDNTGQPNCGLPSNPTPAQQDQANQGLIVTMYICAGVSAAGLLFTLAFTRETGWRELADVDAGSAVLKKHDEEVAAKHAAEAAGAAEAGAAAKPAPPVVDVSTSLLAGAPAAGYATAGKPAEVA